VVILPSKMPTFEMIENSPLRLGEKTLTKGSLESTGCVIRAPFRPNHERGDRCPAGKPAGEVWPGGARPEVWHSPRGREASRRGKDMSLPPRLSPRRVELFDRLKNT